MNSETTSYRKIATSWLIFFLILFMAPLTAHSQAERNGYNNSLIYKIQSPTNTVYILGSIHVLAEEYYPLTRAFNYAYFNSQKVIFEVDPEILFSMSVNDKYKKQLHLKKGQTLKSVLSPKTYSLLKQRLKEVGVPMSKIKKYKPWVVYLSLGRVFNSDMEFRSDLGVESYFFRMAKDAGKPTGGLETVKDQLNVFDKLTFKDQDRLLQDVLSKKDPEEQKQEFLRLVKDWHQGNLTGLERMVETTKKHPRLHKRILVDRNHNWIPQIEEFLKEDKNVLVVVGAAHLAGEDGLLTLLTEKGYTLERASYARP